MNIMDTISDCVKIVDLNENVLSFSFRSDNGLCATEATQTLAYVSKLQYCNGIMVILVFKKESLMFRPPWLCL